MLIGVDSDGIFSESQGLTVGNQEGMITSDAD